MLERLGFGEVEYFPDVTFTLAAIMVAVFLFTRADIVYYENLFGFVPSHPQIYAFITYVFIHVDFTHIFFNVLFLIIAGMTIEKTLGRWTLLAVFFSSGFIAVIFDILGRVISGISFSAPFVGASGGIFGLVAVATLIKPMEKIPTILAVLALLPIGQWAIASSSVFNFSTSTQIVIDGLVAMAALSLLLFIPANVPFFVTLVLFLFSWMIIILLRLPSTVSNVGHLGGVVGALISFFIFGKKKSDSWRTGRV
jgi:membrane associated rhomboid family serine protease